MMQGGGHTGQAAERASDRWVSIVLSVLLHGLLVAALAYGWWIFRQSRPTPTLAIEAVVVDARALTGAARQPAPTPPPPTPPPASELQPQVEPEGPPQPTAEELAKREQEQKEQAEAQRKAQEQQQEAERRAAEEKQAQEKQAEEQREAEAQRQEQERAEAERKAREAAEAKKRAEEKRLAEQKREEQERRKAEEQDKAEREAELKRSLAQEEHAMAVRSSAAVASWREQIAARIRRAWLRPPTARAGIECVLNVTQVPGGEVTNVSIGQCNGDQAVRESIAAAAYRASPLPPPPDPSLFDRNLTITFKPD